jgi:hypothetical protein
MLASCYSSAILGPVECLGGGREPGTHQSRWSRMQEEESVADALNCKYHPLDITETPRDAEGIIA